MTNNTEKSSTASADTRQAHHTENSAGSSVPKGKLRSMVSIFLKSILSLALFIILLLVLGLAISLSSQSSREWLVEDLAPKVLSSNDIQLTIKGFNSPNIGYWYAKNITFNINEKPVFNTNDFLIHFDAATLLKGRLDVIELSAAKLQVSVPPADNSSPGSDINIKEMLIPLRIQTLALHNIDVTSSQFTIPLFQLRGQTALLWQKELFTSHLKLINNTQPDAFINLQANINKQFIRISVFN